MGKHSSAKRGEETITPHCALMEIDRLHEGYKYHKSREEAKQQQDGKRKKANDREYNQILEDIVANKDKSGKINLFPRLRVFTEQRRPFYSSLFRRILRYIRDTPMAKLTKHVETIARNVEGMDKINWDLLGPYFNCFDLLLLSLSNNTEKESMTIAEKLFDLLRFGCRGVNAEYSLQCLLFYFGYGLYQSKLRILDFFDILIIAVSSSFKKLHSKIHPQADFFAFGELVLAIRRLQNAYIGLIDIITDKGLVKTAKDEDGNVLRDLHGNVVLISEGDDEGLLNLIEDIDVTPLTYQLDFPWMREHSLKREDLSDALLLKMMKKGLLLYTTHFFWNCPGEFKKDDWMLAKQSLTPLGVHPNFDSGGLVEAYTLAEDGEDAEYKKVAVPRHNENKSGGVVSLKSKKSPYGHRVIARLLIPTSGRRRAELEESHDSYIVLIVEHWWLIADPKRFSIKRFILYNSADNYEEDTVHIILGFVDPGDIVLVEADLNAPSFRRDAGKGNKGAQNVECYYGVFGELFAKIGAYQQSRVFNDSGVMLDVVFSNVRIISFELAEMITKLKEERAKETERAREKRAKDKRRTKDNTDGLDVSKLEVHHTPFGYYLLIGVPPQIKTEAIVNEVSSLLETQ